jgi:biotin carboxyl carrier protein
VTLHITAGGRAHVVDITRQGDKFLVSVDGRQRVADVKVVHSVWSLLVGPLHVEAGFNPPHGVSRPGRSYEVLLSPSSEGSTTVHVDGVPVEVLVAQTRRPRAGIASHSAGEGPQRVTAPMPGKVVKLLVKQGDKVQSQQGVVVVEAMKMENELRAHAAGTVSEVRVTEGSSVEAGAILVVFE